MVQNKVSDMILMYIGLDDKCPVIVISELAITCLSC